MAIDETDNNRGTVNCLRGGDFYSGSIAVIK
jgi:hypothetical protein